MVICCSADYLILLMICFLSTKDSLVSKHVLLWFPLDTVANVDLEACSEISLCGILHTVGDCIS